MARRRDLGTAWWSRRWLGALEERALVDPNRLPRGRTYARQGAVQDITLGEGVIDAVVAGSRRTPYRVTIGYRRFGPDEWDRVFEVIASKVGFAAEMLDGSVPAELVEATLERGVDLLPGPGDLEMVCSCPDWAVPCKHLAAACYVTADALDGDPFLLLQLRGMGREEVIGRLSVERANALDVAEPETADIAAEVWSEADALTPGDRVAVCEGIGRGWGDTGHGVVPAASAGNSRWHPDLHAELWADVDDAASRARAAMETGEPVFADTSRLVDAARLAAGDTSGERARRARTLGLGRGLLDALADSWEVGGVAAVEAAVEFNGDEGDAAWHPVDDLVAALVRTAAEAWDVRVRRSDRWIAVVGRKRRLATDSEGRWWALERRHGAWVVVAGVDRLDRIGELFAN